MSIEEICKLCEDDLVKEPMAGGNMDKIHFVADELDKASDEAKKLILRGIDEESLVKFITMCQLVSVMYCTREGQSTVLLPNTSGHLASYTQTVVLMIIGMLCKEGIL